MIIKLLKFIRNAWRSIFRKRRFAMLNATDNSEEWHMHLSPASIFTGIVAFVLLLFILVLSLMAYTPVLEFLPGYRTEAGRSREQLIQNILRVDSLERVVNDMMTYNENIALVMEGKTPVARTYTSTSDSMRSSKILVMPSREDSLLRAQMEGEGPYSLANSRAPRRRQIGETMLLTPIDGIITQRFSIRGGSFGVRIAAAAASPVTAIDDGTVVVNRWTPEEGHALGIQHTNNLLSIYRHLSQPLVIKGDRIRSGELIGYSAEVQEGKVEAFEFELWNNGKPVDPEGYIVF